MEQLLPDAGTDGSPSTAAATISVFKPIEEIGELLLR